MNLKIPTVRYSFEVLKYIKSPFSENTGRLHLMFSFTEGTSSWMICLMDSMISFCSTGALVMYCDTCSFIKINLNLKIGKNEKEGKGRSGTGGTSGTGYPAEKNL